MSERFDIAILGFGKAGKTIAAKLASKGKKVVLVMIVQLITDKYLLAG